MRKITLLAAAGGRPKPSNPEGEPMTHTRHPIETSQRKSQRITAARPMGDNGRQASQRMTCEKAKPEAELEGHLITITEAAKYLRVSVPTIRRLIRSGDLKAFRVFKRKVRILAADVGAYVQKQKWQM